MKKRCFFLFALGLMLALLACAGAEEARDITSRCRITMNQNRNDKEWLTDGRYKTYWNGGKNAWLEITTPENDPCWGLYVQWAQTLRPVEIQTQLPDGTWTKVQDGPEHLFYNQYIPLNGLTHFRIHAADPEAPAMCVGEIHMLSSGEVPDWVQQWEPFEGKADMMLVVAHPDDEVLWFGGLIPLYRGQLEKKILVISVSTQPASRKCELLDCLWTCGVREYPVVSGNRFKDEYKRSLNAILSLWGKDQLNTFVTRLIRQYRPDVLVSHDLNGEYGHGAHKACAWSAVQCLSLAADPTFDPGSAKEWGVWKIRKLYLHLYEEGQIIMDWRQPLEAFGGATGFDVACAGFKRHRTQQSGKYVVEDWGKNDCRILGLYYSAVGPDEQGNDLFEHIEIE